MEVSAGQDGGSEGRGPEYGRCWMPARAEDSLQADRSDAALTPAAALCYWGKAKAR